MKGYMISVSLLFVILTLVCGRRVQNPCEDDKLPCDNGQCILRSYWCDRFDDCEDESDLKYCKASGNDCTDIHFECENRWCIPASSRCDNTSDCPDGSDEKNCETIDPEETPRTLTSSTKASIPDPFTTPESYYNRREDESYKPPPNVYNNNYNHGYAISNQNSHLRGSDTLPGGNFPNNLQPSIPPYIPRTTPRARTRPDPSRSGYPHIQREKAVIFPPRSISYVPQHSRSSNYPRRNIKTPNYSHFYFDRNFTRDISNDYKTNIRNAKKWLLSKRNSFYGWDRDTPRALIALSLISNSFQSDVEENELLRKSLQTHLGVKLLRNNTGIEQMSTTRLAMYMNALLATCQDPRDFLGLDLAEILFYRQSYLEQDQKFVNPLIYLTLCLTDMPVNVEYLQGFLSSSLSTEVPKDLHILATTAMACVAQQYPTDRYIKSIVDAAARNLTNYMKSDGSFGSKYSTALAAQVLMSVNTSRWDNRKTLNYLADQQEEDGSFGDMQSTYYTLIALSGRSLLHIRNTLCDTSADIKKASSGCFPDDILNGDGPRKSILYTLRVDYPESFSAGLRLSVPLNTSFYEIMCVAAHQDRRFKYDYKITHGQLGIHTIANLPNDPERGKFWNLYWLPISADTLDLKRRHPGDIRRLIPLDGDEMIFWYLNDVDI